MLDYCRRYCPLYIIVSYSWTYCFLRSDSQEVRTGNALRNNHEDQTRLNRGMVKSVAMVKSGPKMSQVGMCGSLQKRVVLTLDPPPSTLRTVDLVQKGREANADEAPANAEPCTCPCILLALHQLCRSGISQIRKLRNTAACARIWAQNSPSPKHIILPVYYIPSPESLLKVCWITYQT